jgi:hypothetical protein
MDVSPHPPLNLLRFVVKIDGICHPNQRLLLSPAERRSIIDEAVGKQQVDGGFSLPAFVG